MRFFPIAFIGTLIAFHLYVIWSMRRAFGNGLWQIAPIAMMLMTVGSFFLGRSIRGSLLAAVPYVWLALLLFAVLWLAIRDVLALAVLLGNRWAGWRVPVLLMGSRTIILALILAVLTFFYGLIEAGSIRVRQFELPTALLPADVDKVRIVALTDLHLIPNQNAASLGRIVDLVNARDPDIVVVVGDVMDGNFSDAVAEIELFRKIRAKSGKFAVVGNHEIYSGLAMAIRFLERGGFTVLRGDAAEAGGISIAGVDDPHVHTRTGIAEALAKANAEKFILLLSHRPEVPEAAAGLFDLEIAGHTHGGQIWPGRYLARLLNGFGQGFTAVRAPDGRPRHQSLLYVSNGTRQWGPPVRFLTPPEITVFDLVRQD